jgi:hypothetical protein
MDNMVISSTINCLYHAKPENALQNEIDRVWARL